MENWLGPRIKRLRSIQGITQEKLAELCNVSPSCISRWERGDLYPRREHILVLAQALGIEPEDLFNAPGGSSANNQLVKESVFLLEKLDHAEQEYFLKSLQSYLEMKRRKLEDN